MTIYNRDYQPRQVAPVNIVYQRRANCSLLTTYDACMQLANSIRCFRQFVWSRAFSNRSYLFLINKIN